MKILLIDSDAHYEKKGHFYIHKNSGVFVNKLTNMGLDISMFHFNVKHTPEAVAEYKLDSDKLSIYNVKKSKSKLISHFKALFTLTKLIKKFDLLYIFYPNAFFYTIFLALIFKKKYAMYIRGEKNINSKLSSYFYKHAKFVTTVSPVFTKLVAESGGIGFTIKPMIAFDLRDIIVKKNNVIKPVFFNILYIGRVERDKGIFELMEAVKTLKEKNIIDFRLNIIGNGEHFNQIKEIISEYCISNLVKLHGVITDKETIKTFYQKSDIFVMTSHHEGFPRVLYEAMIFNVPIITTFVGAIPYLMKDDFNCIRIEVSNSNSIADKLLYVINNNEVRNYITANATDTITDYLKKNSMSHEQIILQNI